MKGKYVAIFLLTNCLFLNFGCVKKSHPFGKPPSFFFADQKVIALCSAILESDCLAVEQLIQDDVDINMRGQDGITPLLWTLALNDKQAFALLLDAGANPNIQTITGDSVMSFVAGIPDSFFVNLVLAHGGNPNLVNPVTERTPLLETIYHNQYENMKILITHGANVNYATPMGHTVVMDAASLNRYDMVYYLLLNCADACLASDKRLTFIDYLKDDLRNPNLLRSGELFEAKGNVVKLLESKGIDVSELKKLLMTLPAK